VTAKEGGSIVSNLGGYQLMTTLAKKVGGPTKLALLAFGIGYIILRPSEAVVKKIYNKVKSKIYKNLELSGYTETTFEVTSDGKDSNGLEFSIGDKYRILESDGNAILIEKLGDSNNPYFVSDAFLRTISNTRGAL